jgi:hypothetical protein
MMPQVDLVVPVFTFLQFFFYMGWLKVGAVTSGTASWLLRPRRGGKGEPSKVFRGQSEGWNHLRCLEVTVCGSLLAVEATERGQGRII